MTEIASLLNDSPEWVEVKVEESTFSVAYHPARVTPLWLAKLQGADDDPMTLPTVLSELVSDWDVTENGQALPLDAEVLGSLPYKVIGAISLAVSQAAAGSEEKNDSNASTEASDSGHTTPSSTASRQNGTDTRPLLASGSATPGNS